MARAATTSDAPVAARERLDQAKADDAAPQEQQLKTAVTEQEKAQAEQLKAGRHGVAKDGPTLADNRVATGKGQSGVSGGFIDQITRRDVTDCMEGHFCTIDTSHKDVDLPDGEDGYGVYVGPAVADDNGYPVTGTVRLHNSPQLVTVPYEAIRPSDPRGR